MKFCFVVATQKKKGEHLPILDFLSQVDLPDSDTKVECDIEYENKEGLPTVYNRAMDNYPDGDFYVFVHDDITINDYQFFEKVRDSKFDVIGPVGGKAWVIPNNLNPEIHPIIWTTATCGRGMSGFMNHHHNNEFMPSSYGVCPSRTWTLDGCCIIFNKPALEAGLRWDEDFQYHFYDMSVCFRANQLGLTVGTAPLLLTHESIGESVRQDEFMKSQQKFIEKYFRKSAETT